MSGYFTENDSSKELCFYCQFHREKDLFGWHVSFVSTKKKGGASDQMRDARLALEKKLTRGHFRSFVSEPHCEEEDLLPESPEAIRCFPIRGDMFYLEGKMSQNTKISVAAYLVERGFGVAWYNPDLDLYVVQHSQLDSIPIGQRAKITMNYPQEEKSP